MDNSLIPVYREGFANPWLTNDWFDRFAMDPFSAGGRGVGDPWSDMMRQPTNPAADMMRQMNRMMEPLLPFERPSRPSSGQISWQPSALSPKYDSDRYRVEIQAQDFKPNEITVKTVSRHNHNFLVCEGKHETTDEVGYHSIHHFKRQYMLPDSVDPTTLKSSLDNKGVLAIMAPIQQKAIQNTERMVPMETAATATTTAPKSK